MERALSSADYESLAELRYQIRRFLHFSEQTSRLAGLRPHQHQLMLALKGLPGRIRPRIGELASGYRFDITVRLSRCTGSLPATMSGAIAWVKLAAKSGFP